MILEPHDIQNLIVDLYMFCIEHTDKKHVIPVLDPGPRKNCKFLWVGRGRNYTGAPDKYIIP